MFVRLKTKGNRDNVTLVAHKISGILESKHGNTVIMDNGSEYVVEESERVIRSKMLKAFSNSGDEANEASEA